ncbi:MAG: hypothetical protein ABIQ66_04705 [Novosphingobium sp.]
MSCLTQGPYGTNQLLWWVDEQIGLSEDQNVSHGEHCGRILSALLVFQ